MKEDQNSYLEDDIIGAVNRFKRSLISGRTRYFDVSEFEGIVEQLLEEGDLRNSEIAAKQGIQIHPNAVPLQLKYAQVLINKGKYEKSLKYIQFAEKIDSSNPDVYMLKGSARMVMGNEKEALLSFKKALKHAGGDVDDVLYQIGMSYVQVGEFAKAIIYMEKAVTTNPKNETALYDLGFFCDQMGNYKKSIKYYNKYLDLNPFNHTVWFNLGTVYNKLNKHQKAIEAYEFALALNDDLHMALFNIGNAFANEEKFEEAIEKYTEFIEIEPDNDDAHCYIAECFLNMEDNLSAEFFYKKALEINNQNDSAWFGLGLVKWVERKFNDSIKYLTNSIEIDSDNQEYWLTLGKVNKDYQNKEEAAAAFKQAARLDPDNIEVWITWADLLVSYKELNNSIRIIKRGIKNNPEPTLKYKLVALFLENKNEKEAFEWLLIAMKQEFEQINYLFDIYPKALKNKKLKKVVDDYRRNNIPK